MYLSLALLAATALPMLGIVPLMRKSIPPYRVVMEGIIAGTIGAIVVIIIAKFSYQGVYEEMQEQIEYVAKSLANNPSIAQVLESNDMQETERIDYFETVLKLAADMLPSSFMILAAIASYIEYILFSKFVKTENTSGVGTAAIPMPPFREFTLPRNSIVGWVAILLLSWVVTKAGLIANDLLYININAIFNFAFCLQGMSVVFQFCHKKHAPKAIAVIVILFFFTTIFGKWTLFLLGLIDLIFDLKARLK